MNSLHLAYNYSQCVVNLLHAINEHRKYMTARKCCTVLIGQHISDIRVPNFGANNMLFFSKSLTHLDALNL